MGCAAIDNNALSQQSMTHAWKSRFNSNCARRGNSSGSSGIVEAQAHHVDRLMSTGRKPRGGDFN